MNENKVDRVGYAYAPSNIALIKYWGKRNTEINLPMNSSFSVSLGSKGATARVQISSEPVLIINNTLSTHTSWASRIFKYVSSFYNTPYHIALNVNIPFAAGLASSACVFAALILALDNLYAWHFDTQTLSILARLGSGSAARSIQPGFVEWHKGESEGGVDSYAEVFPYPWPAFCIGLCVVDATPKKISSREGMLRTVQTSPLYAAWPAAAEEAIQFLKKAIIEQNFTAFGQIAEHNALTMHATMHSAWPPVVYSTPETIRMMQLVWSLREQGLAIYFTQDAGPNLKLLFLEKDIPIVQQYFNAVDIIRPFFN